MEKKSLIPYAKQQKLREWAGMIEARRKSGLQVKEWCEANQISERAYYYRHRLVMKMLDQIGTEQQNSTFAEIHLDKEISDSIAERNILIRFPGVEILIPDGLSSNTINSVIQSIRKPC